MEKEIKEIKTCGLCNWDISPKDNYVEIIDYHNGVFFMRKYYHTKCFNDKLTDGKDLKKMKQQAFELLSKARGMVGLKDEEVIQI